MLNTRHTAFVADTGHKKSPQFKKENPYHVLTHIESVKTYRAYAAMNHFFIKECGD